MDETGNDFKLIDLYMNGEISALQELVEKYKSPLFGYILNMTGGRCDADEIFQETWFRAIKKIDKFKQNNFLGWLIRIAHNFVIDQGRRRKPDMSLDAEKEEGYSLTDTIPGKDIDPEKIAANTEVAKKIAEAVTKLPELQREVFLMRMEVGLPFKEIAKIQKVTINTALARMQYALSRLRKVLRKDYKDLSRF